MGKLSQSISRAQAVAEMYVGPLQSRGCSLLSVTKWLPLLECALLTSTECTVLGLDTGSCSHLPASGKDYSNLAWPAVQLISQIVNARVAIVRLGDFLAADVQPELPLIPPAPPGESASPRS